MVGRTLAVLVLGVAAAGAVQTPLGPRTIDEAVTLGKSAVERDRTNFHAPYRLTIARPPVDYIEVITPFRRVVLAAEQRARAGDRSFGQRQVLADPALAAGELELRAELTFHPLNTYVAVPEYSLTLSGAGSPRVEPRTFNRAPRYTPRVDGQPSVTSVPGAPTLPGTSQPIIGGTVSAAFDLRTLNPNALYEVVLWERDAEISRARLDLSRLR
jgi:hypothetical protein